MAVIKDVAKLAGVSVSTVSKYLNRPDSLKEEYREKIQNAINILQYKPSSLARSMRTRKTNLIALIVPEMSNFYYSEIYSAVRVAAGQYGYTIILYTTEESVSVLKRYLTEIVALGVDGIIICFLDEDEMIECFAEVQRQIPIALMGWDINNTRFNSAIVDVFDGIYHATRHLIELGHHEIAFIGGPLESRISKEKFNGYKLAMQQEGIQIRPEFISSGKYRFQTGYFCTRNFMGLTKRPTAIVCANDVLAIGAIKYLISNEIRVPEECSVIGFDGTSLSSIYQPAVSTMAQPIADMGVEIMKLLAAKIRNPKSKNKQIIFKTTLTARETTVASTQIEFEF